MSNVINNFGFEKSTKCAVLSTTSSYVVGAAILTISILGMSGILPMNTAGFTIAGLGGGLLVTNLIGVGSNRKVSYLTFELIGALALVGVGVCGGCGLLSSLELLTSVVGIGVAAHVIKFMTKRSCEKIDFSSWRVAKQN